MLRIIEKACGLLAAVCKNIVLFSLAAVLMLIAGAVHITLLNVELEAARNENAALSHRNAELIESAYSRELLIDEMRMELEAADEKQSLVIREELRFLGFIKLGVRKRYYEDNGEDALIMVCDHMPEADPDFEEAETVLE